MSTGSRIHRKPGDALRLALFSVHGLIRGHELELGRDADTGGQTLYVVELARALAQRPDVAQVDLFTRRVVDPNVSPNYAKAREPLSEKARIVRVNCGPDGYIRKEALWDHLDGFADSVLDLWREEGNPPHVIHSHYADAGYIGVRLASQLGVPLVHTGHSLGRVKRRRLLASGVDRDQIESRYNMARRIEAEEDTLGTAELVIASTQNEVEEQYGLYDQYQPDQMRVVPPGTDLERFLPPDGSEEKSAIARQLTRFLSDPDKPMILAISRPDERKNIVGLINAYGESRALQRLANLVIVAGNRDDIAEMDAGPGRVLVDILMAIDRYDLYGKVAYPKAHSRADVPTLYRLAAARRGVFVNPALTEPFGLTLIESAASGLPIVATEDGGPRDIVRNCQNGHLVDPLDSDAMGATIFSVLSDRKRWQRLAANGLAGVEAHYTWPAHGERYMTALEPLLAETQPRPRPQLPRRPMLYHDRALFTDLDQNLLGDPKSLADFVGVMRENRHSATFGIATGRRLESALRIMRRYGIPQPDVLITSVGTAIHYAPNMTLDTTWQRHIEHLWTPRDVRTVLAELPGLILQPRREQSRFKISYYIDPETAPPLEDLTSLLRQHEQSVSLFLSFGQFLDILPVRASKGFALRWFAEHWGIPLEQVLAAGGSGSDEDMMRGNTLAVVVANRHEEELSQLTKIENVYFAKKPFAAGILEAIEHYDFYGACTVPETT